MQAIEYTNVIHILYNWIWFISGFCSLFTSCLARSMDTLLASEVNWLASQLSNFVLLLHFTLSFIIDFSLFCGSIGLLGLGFSIRVNVKF